MAKRRNTYDDMLSEARLRELADRAKHEPDSTWRNWFLDVERKRRALAEQRKKLVISTFEKDGQTVQVARPAGNPTQIKRFLKVEKKKTGSRMTQDLAWIREAWTKTVSGDIAAESEVYAFKGGVLTVTVFSGILLQEIRQFHADAILEDMRAIWQASTPLLTIQYRLGGR